jgi:hypothetical protein
MITDNPDDNIPPVLVVGYGFKIVITNLSSHISMILRYFSPHGLTNVVE